MSELSEPRRRKPGAGGRPVELADGRPWLLAEPTFRAGAPALTSPDVDALLDRFHEQITLGEDLSLDDVQAAARILLLANYDLNDSEAAELLEVDAGPEAEALARAVFESLFGHAGKAQRFTDWVRASLLANGLDSTEIPASAINDVLSILMATNRTLPPSRFIDACRMALDRDSLERLV